ncbi:MAG: hypothetical protein A3K60_04095 [Euryarchaeota archaeon RBG_19FT_COMBO_56_21]|nr:MAG: hypothetical protein A3K60_04095 [Euryarchaeota archaeon RBG_19FT_COMBO_56_21]
MIPEGTQVMLIDASGKKHLLKARKQMIEVGGLGVINGDSICGSDYGDALKVGSKEFLICRPSLKDLLGIIERRAQILIPKDSFSIPMHLDLGCGDRVIEGGVGSGALTLVLLRAVGPSGAVHSYEIRKDFAAIAEKNVSLSENAGSWKLHIADICTADLEKEADAGVLDIPNPWDALPNLVKAIRIGGFVCSYVPNVNQLEATVRKMRELGLDEVVAFETLQREMIVHEGGVRPSFDMLGHTGYLAFGRKMRNLL